MANSEGSASSSLDPMVELVAEVKVLRRRVRRHGHFLQQLDEMGGHHLAQIEDDMGRLRSDLMAALQKLEEKVAISLDNWESRLQRMEGMMVNLRDAGTSGHTMSQNAARSPAGALGKQH